MTTLMRSDNPNMAGARRLPIKGSGRGGATHLTTLIWQVHAAFLERAPAAAPNMG